MPGAALEPEPIVEEEPEPEEVDEEEEEEAEEEVLLDDEKLLGVADGFLDTGSFSKAYRCYQELLDRGIENPDLLVKFAKAGYRNRFISNKKERLLDVAWVIKRALVLDRTFVQAYLTFGEILEKEKKADLAEDQYRAALVVDPNNAKARVALKRVTR